MGLPAGTRVTYGDEPTPPTIVGTVSEPTRIELQHAVDTDYASEGVGPEHGDVIVHWDGDDPTDRSWENPRDLTPLCPIDLHPVAEIAKVVDRPDLITHRDGFQHQGLMAKLAFKAGKENPC